jgi:hypothetical protein
VTEPPHGVPKLLVCLGEGVSLFVQASQKAGGRAVQDREWPVVSGGKRLVALPETDREAGVGRIHPQLRIGSVVQCSDIKGLGLQSLFPGIPGQIKEPGGHEGGRIGMSCGVPWVQGQEGEEKNGSAAVGTRLTTGGRLPEGGLRTGKVPLGHEGEAGIEHAWGHRFRN